MVSKNVVVSIGIVALNEELYIQQLLEDINSQKYNLKNIELLLIDSGSKDLTKDIFNNFKKKNLNKYYDIQILDNVLKKQACGWNIAIENFKGDCLIRLDAHARIPNEFVTENVNAINNGENIVGGPRPTICADITKWNNTLLLAEESLFGSSIASYRRKVEKKYVNSMFHACYKREVLEKVKKFNEYLGRTEDNEFHYRIRKKGYKLLYTPKITSNQIIRNSLKKMIKQKYGNGYWIGITTYVAPQCLSLHHYIPFLFVLSIIFCGLLAILGISIMLTLLLITYFLFDIINTLMSFKNPKANITTLLLVIIFPILHISYGVGTIVGFIKGVFWKDKKNAKTISNGNDK